MKTVQLTALAVLVTLTTFSPVSAAGDPPVAKKKPSITTAKADLQCSIRVWEDDTRTRPVKNGAALVYGGGTPSLWVEVMITNAGADAGAAAYSSTIGGHTTVKEYIETLTIPGGLSKVYPLVQVPMAAVGNYLSVEMQLDVEGVVTESSELNNLCRFNASAQVVK